MLTNKTKYILLFTIVGWFVNFIGIGKSYTGSSWGNIIFIASCSFVVVFLYLNYLKIEEIKDDKTVSNFKNITFLLILYPIIVVILNIVGSFKLPSTFLISLFIIYLILTITWIVFFENKTITKHSAILLFLTLLPLAIGIYSIGAEHDIENSITDLNSQVVYYENNLDNITKGSITKNSVYYIIYDIQSLKSDLEFASSRYLVGDFSSSENTLKEAEVTNDRLKDGFNLLEPKYSLYDIIQTREKTIDRLYSKTNNRNIEGKQILVDLNLTKTKLDFSWEKYRDGDFQASYDTINNIDDEIEDIDKRIERNGYYIIVANQSQSGHGPISSFPLLLVSIIIFGTYGAIWGIIYLYKKIKYYREKDES